MNVAPIHTDIHGASVPTTTTDPHIHSSHTHTHTGHTHTHTRTHSVHTLYTCNRHRRHEQSSLALRCTQPRARRERVTSILPPPAAGSANCSSSSSNGAKIKVYRSSFAQGLAHNKSFRCCLCLGEFAWHGECISPGRAATAAAMVVAIRCYFVSVCV